MTLEPGHNLTSPFAKERAREDRRLGFDEFAEEVFRQEYSKAVAQRARLLLSLAVATVLLLVGARIADASRSWFMVAFEVGVILPVLIATIYVSTDDSRHRLFQWLLLGSTLLLGLVLNSIVTRATLYGMPYYFGATIAWVFVCWLILGLLFRYAAVATFVISATYAWGLFNWNVDSSELIFEVVLLIAVNLIGAYCCYQLERAVRQSFLESRVLGELAERDGLTGLYNRRSFDQHMERLWRQSRREQTQLTLLLIDIDHFKTFNDLKGHQAGDDALKQVADVIGQGAQRALDFAARYGGEEFALLLYGPAQELGRRLPDELRQAVRDLKIKHPQSTSGPYLTVSIGVAIMMPEAERSLAGAIQMADEALYQAKEDGRNRVVVRESPNSTLQTGRFRARRALSA